MPLKRKNQRFFVLCIIKKKKNKKYFRVSPLCWLFLQHFLKNLYTENSAAHGSHFVYVHDIFFFIFVFFFFLYILKVSRRRLNIPSLLNNREEKKIFFGYMCYMILSNSIYLSIYLHTMDRFML